MDGFLGGPEAAGFGPCANGRTRSACGTARRSKRSDGLSAKPIGECSSPATTPSRGFWSLDGRSAGMRRSAAFSAASVAGHSRWASTFRSSPTSPTIRQGYWLLSPASPAACTSWWMATSSCGSSLPTTTSATVAERQHLARLRGELADQGVVSTEHDMIGLLADGGNGLRDVDAVVACSYHVGLTALLLGLPTLLVYGTDYYAHKAEGLRRTFGLTDRMLVDARRLAEGAAAGTGGAVGGRAAVPRKRVQGDGVRNRAHGHGERDGSGHRRRIRRGRTGGGRGRQVSGDGGRAVTMERLSDLQVDYARLLERRVRSPPLTAARVPSVEIVEPFRCRLRNGQALSESELDAADSPATAPGVPNWT